MIHRLVFCLPVALAAVGLATGLTPAAVAQQQAAVPVDDLIRVLTSRDAFSDEVASVSRDSGGAGSGIGSGHSSSNCQPPANSPNCESWQRCRGWVQPPRPPCLKSVACCRPGRLSCAQPRLIACVGWARQVEKPCPTCSRRWAIPIRSPSARLRGPSTHWTRRLSHPAQGSARSSWLVPGQRGPADSGHLVLHRQPQCKRHCPSPRSASLDAGRLLYGPR